MRRGLSLVGIIVIVVILLIVGIYLINFTTTKVVPTVKQLSQPEQLNLMFRGIKYTDYYVLTFIPDACYPGHVEFTVLDPLTGFYETNFSKIATDGYLVSENGHLTQKSNVDAYLNLNVAIVADPGLDATCNTILDKLKAVKFKNVNVGFFPADTEFKPVSDIVSCTSTGGDYWGAIKAATFTLPADETSYNALLIISNGNATSCPNCNVPDQKLADTIADAMLGLQRENINVWVLPAVRDTCASSDLLNITCSILGINQTTFESNSPYRTAQCGLFR